MDLKNSYKMLTNAYLSFFHDLDLSFLSGFYSLTIRYQVGVVCFLSSRQLTFVFILPFCQRDPNHRANGNASNAINDEPRDDDDDKNEEREDDDDDIDSEKKTTTMPHQRRPLGKAKKRAMRLEEERKTASVRENEGLPPPSAYSTPKSVGEEERRKRPVSLVVTATSTTRAVIANPTPKKKKKEEDGVTTLPSGRKVVIEWAPEGVAVEVGEPHPAPPRRNSRDVVDRGVGPSSGCGPWKGSCATAELSFIDEAPSTSNRCEILAPYLVPTTPKRKKSRANAAETAPDPDAPTTPAISI